MTDRDSSYYPPRANFWTPLVKRFETFCRVFSLRAIHIPDTVTLFGLIGGLLVPGLALYLRNPEASGKAALAVCAFLLLVFIALLGYPAANAAFTLLLTIHLIGLVAYCKPIFAGSHWPSRLIGAFFLSLVTIVLVYLPFQSWLEQHLVVPLRVHGHVVVVRCSISPRAIHRGDWIAFRLVAGQDHFQEGNAHGRVVVRDGISMSPVLAIPGDHLQFDKDSFSVNGVAQPRQKDMPVSGEWTVPANCWFAWTDMASEGHGYVPDSEIADVSMYVAKVYREQLVGKAFKHWFGRRQLFS